MIDSCVQPVFGKDICGPFAVLFLLNEKWVRYFVVFLLMITKSANFLRSRFKETVIYGSGYPGNA